MSTVTSATSSVSDSSRATSAFSLARTPTNEYSSVIKYNTMGIAPTGKQNQQAAEKAFSSQGIDVNRNGEVSIPNNSLGAAILVNAVQQANTGPNGLTEAGRRKLEYFTDKFTHTSMADHWSPSFRSTLMERAQAALQQPKRD